MPAAPRTRMVNSTSAWCVIAHSDRLKRFMPGAPFARCRDQSRLLDRSHLLTGVEFLDAERDHPLAIRDARADEGDLAGEGGDRHRPQRELARLIIDDEDR